MSSKIYPVKLEWTSNADRLKLNGWIGQPDISLIGAAIVAFVRRKVGTNFCETQKLQAVQTHKTSHQKSSWHTGYNPSVSTGGPTFETQHWHLSLKYVQCWRQDVNHVVVSYSLIFLFI